MSSGAITTFDAGATQPRRREEEEAGTFLPGCAGRQDCSQICEVSAGTGLEPPPLLVARSHRLIVSALPKEIAQLLPPRKETRLEFLRSRFITLVKMYLTMDLVRPGERPVLSLPV